MESGYQIVHVAEGDTATAVELRHSWPARIVAVVAAMVLWGVFPLALQWGWSEMTDSRSGDRSADGVFAVLDVLLTVGGVVSMTVVFAAALLFTYLAVAVALNRRTLCLDETGFAGKEGPVPVRFRYDVPRQQVEAIEVEQRWMGRVGSSVVDEISDLVLSTTDGRRIRLGRWNRGDIPSRVCAALRRVLASI